MQLCAVSPLHRRAVTELPVRTQQRPYYRDHTDVITDCRVASIYCRAAAYKSRWGQWSRMLLLLVNLHTQQKWKSKAHRRRNIKVVFEIHVIKTLGSRCWISTSRTAPVRNKAGPWGSVQLLHHSEEHLKANYVTTQREDCPSSNAPPDAPPSPSFWRMHRYDPSRPHISQDYLCTRKKNKEREKMATSRGVDRHFRGPGRQKLWRKGKTSGDTTRKCSKD